MKTKLVRVHFGLLRPRGAPGVDLTRSPRHFIFPDHVTRFLCSLGTSSIFLECITLCHAVKLFDALFQVRLRSSSQCSALARLSIATFWAGQSCPVSVSNLVFRSPSHFGPWASWRVCFSSCLFSCQNLSHLCQKLRSFPEIFAVNNSELASYFSGICGLKNVCRAHVGHSSPSLCRDFSVALPKMLSQDVSSTLDVALLLAGATNSNSSKLSILQQNTIASEFEICIASIVFSEQNRFLRTDVAIVATPVLGLPLEPLQDPRTVARHPT